MPPSGGVVADTLRDLLARSGVLAHVVLPPEPDAVLAALEVTSPPQDRGGFNTGGVVLVHDLSKSPIPGFDFGLAVPEPGITVPFKLKLEPPDAPTAFKAWLQLADEKHALAVFTFVEGVPGYALTGATRVVDPDGSVRLQALPAGDPNAKPRLVSRSVEPGAALGPALLIAGSATSPASIRFTPDTDSTDGIVTLGLQASTVVFGTSSVGFDCPFVVIDDSETAAGPGQGARPGSAEGPDRRGIRTRSSWGNADRLEVSANHRLCEIGPRIAVYRPQPPEVRLR